MREEISDELRLVQQLKHKVSVGAVDTKVVNRVRHYRISTVQEMVAMESLIERASNLSMQNNEIMSNPWGFPFIPVPDWSRYGDGSAGMILAPKTISYEWLGYPIYWIDPVLTHMTPDERKDPARWCVRMYFLLMAFGFFIEDPHAPGHVKWVNALRARGVDYTEEDWTNYCRGFDVPEVSSVVYTYDDLRKNGVDISDINAHLSTAMRRIKDVTERFANEYNDERRQASVTARGYLVNGGEGKKRAEKVVADAAQITKDFNDSFAENKGSISGVEIVDRLFANAEEAIKTINEMDRCAFIIKPFVLREVVANRLQFSFVATALSNYASLRRTTHVDEQINKAATALSRFTPGVDEPESIFNYTNTIHRLMRASHNELKLNVINAMRMDDGKDPFKDIHELEAATLNE